MKNLIGKQVIVRSHLAGVFFGTLEKKEGTELTLTNVRKLYYWSGAAAIEQIALEGVKNPNNCKFTVTVDQIMLPDYVQILPCTKKAIDIIKSIKEWKI